MELQAYRDTDWREVAALFNRVFAGRFRLLPMATEAGYVRDRLQTMMADAPASQAWVARKNGCVVGFVSAHARGADRGLITTPVFEGMDSDVADSLLAAAEGFLQNRGTQRGQVSGVSRGYNVGFGEPLHMWLLERGYESYDYEGLEVGMELDLTRLSTAPTVGEFRRKNEADGLVFEFLQEQHVESLKQIAKADWMRGGFAAPVAEGPRRYPYAVCREGDTVIGFCGGCGVDRRYAMGGWAFILLRGWTPDLSGRYFHRGIGAVLLSMANEWLKANGARFQIIFTAVHNRTQRLYRKAGYRYCFVSARDIVKGL